MKERKDLLFSSGKISEEDLKWDISFWQSASSNERFLAAAELIKNTFKHKFGSIPPMSIDKTSIITGSFNND